MEDVGKSAAIVVADVGGASSGTSPYDVAKFEAVLLGEVAMGLAAHNLGEAELKLGAEELKRLNATTKVPFISANALAINYATPPMIVVVRAGRRIAIVGVISPAFATTEFKIRDPAAAVLNALSGANESFETSVVLAYLPTDELESLARALPEVDLIVGGPTRQSIEPKQMGPVTLAAVTNKGKFMARFDLASPGTQPAWRGEIVELDDHWTDQPDQVANLSRFRNRLAERDFAANETSFVGALATNLPGHYRVAGSESCVTCHQGDCELWQGTTHATAWKTLEKNAAHVDSYCQQCHTTGFGMPGGFASARQTADRVNVGCESCHGPSLAHVEDPREHTTLAAREQCIGCHDRENSPEFAFDDYWSRIEHGTETTAASNSPTAEKVTK